MVDGSGLLVPERILSLISYVPSNRHIHLAREALTPSEYSILLLNPRNVTPTATISDTGYPSSKT